MISINIENSQNFLHDSKLVKKIIDLTKINNDDLILEIGPGKGIITDEIIKKAKEVIAIEYDSNLYNNLKQKYDNNENIKLFNKDFLEFDEINKPYKVVSNIPFNITSKILNKLLSDNNAKEIYLIMQYEPYLRYKGEEVFTYKALLYRPFYEMNIMYKFNPTDFKPTPKARIVFSSFIMKNNPDVNLDYKNEYMDFITYLFEKKSKVLVEKIDKLFTQIQIDKIMKKLNLNADVLFMDISYEDLIYIFNTFMKLANDVKKKIIKGFKSQKEKEEEKNDLNPHKNFSNKNNW